MDPRIDEESETGEELRQRVREVITHVQFREFNSVGVQLGYYYEASPIVCYDDEPPPEFVFDRYTPTSRPGSRAPTSGSRTGPRCTTGWEGLLRSRASDPR